MPRLTLASVKSTLARVIGCSESSPDLVSYLNEAQERLMNRGDWRGTLVRYRFCTVDAKLTWPRWVESIRKINVCSGKVPIANRWYEFVGQGPGTLHDTDSPGLVLTDMGEAPIHTDISGTGKKVHAISNEPESGSSYICVQGYDENNAWIRTTHDGELVDGEYILLSDTGAYSTNYFSNVAAVRLDAHNGTVTLSEYDVANAVLAPIGEYEHDELRPAYRRSRIAGMADVGNCGCANDPCSTGYSDVQAIVKLRHIPVSDDNDWLVIGNLPALKDMVLSIIKSEANLPAEAEYYEARAIKELEKELSNHHLGESMPLVDVEYGTFGAGDIEGVI